MNLRSTLAATTLTALVACGASEGPRWQGTIEHEGVIVEYETYYVPPSLVERINNSKGIAARVAIDGKTLALTPGVGYPDEWKNGAPNPKDYTQEFWGGVAAKFKDTVPSQGHENEHHLILSHLEALRDVPRTLPGDYGARRDALTLAPEPVVPVHTDPNAMAETEEEAAYSRQVGQEAVDRAQAECRGWKSGSCGRAKNRGMRHQKSEPGYEYTQRLELWKNHAPFTLYDHSATRAYTYRRPKGSNAPWELIYHDGNQSVDSCNHGDCPEEKDMRHYETCDSGVVSDWYGLDAECEGNWMAKHLCNDDTSMQINQAQGIWTGNKCPGALRGIAPRCGRQFNPDHYAKTW